MYELHSDLPFLPERKKPREIKKLATSLEDKSEYVVHIKSFKQALNYRLILQKVNRVISFNQDECLKSYIEMNTELKQNAKKSFEKNPFKLMNNAVFGKTMENVRKCKNIKLVQTERKRNYLVSEPNYCSTKFFSENLLAIEMKKTQITMNKPVYLGLLILDISKSKMYDFCFNFIKSKYGQKANLCYVDTDSFIAHAKTEDIHSDRPLPMGKMIGLMKDELGGQIMKPKAQKSVS